ncbi:MAG: ABC transporter ATP-binding protein/permease [Clostridium sp.]|nr:ABC transporter ATP-binding protein/permease [Clostridium sp.]MCM1443986.1 ABC transporter ATP-binding protein/permease [Candidatus Amulumruptor caecigallinarius]
MLELKKITKIYEVAGLKQNALNDISVSFRKSEFVSILGQSGSGKTTLLNIIGGLDKYTTGDLVINGISTKKYNDRAWDTYRNHRVGFVFQSYNLIPHQTALQNVELALTLSGIDKEERRKRSIAVLKKVGLEKHINKKPNQMSGGQMQRIAIARALVNDPDILLADEPTGALDSETSVQIMDLLKEIAKEKLVIMVTHNPELANTYSTRIIKLLDGKIVDDSNPYKGEKEEKKEEKSKKSKKTSMNYLTALSLSLNNLLTKKGRTILTAFAGSIGIIGIALILSLSNGIQKYINKTEEETLSSYPLTIQKESIDMASFITTLASNNEDKEYNDNKIHAVNIMGDMFTTMTQKMQKNDLKSFKEYIESDKTNIKDYTSNIQYSYDVTLNLYKNSEDIVRVNPTTIFDALGINTSGISSAYGTMMSNYDVFYELLDNQELNKQQFDLVDGRWPEKYNEVILQVDKNNQITDYTLYSLGILSQDDLKKQFSNMINGKDVSFTENSYDTKDLIGMKFKLLLNTDYYKKQNNIWVDMSDDKEYIKEKLEDALEIEIVGIMKPNEEAVVGTSSAGMVGYRHDLVEYLINEINSSEIAKKQLENKDINVFTGLEFSDNNTFDMNNLSKEQLMYIQGLSQVELTEFINSYKENMSATYEDNLIKLGIVSLEEPSTISLYPKDFDSKDEIVKIIEGYNKDKSEEEKINYTDLVGIMMSSVSTIVDVISAVLIAFVAISLIVSSIMIAIITYISVIERTKEIGILRAIGASKKDISRVFNAETLIEGLIAGVFGILVTIIIIIPANMIIKSVVNISNLAQLPIGGAIILIIISVLLTVIAGFIPAKLASKKDPVVALRTE